MSERERGREGGREGGRLTHPDLPEAALAQLEVQAEGLAGDLPGVPRQTLRLRLRHGTHVRQRVTQAVRVLWNKTPRMRTMRTMTTFMYVWSRDADWVIDPTITTGVGRLRIRLYAVFIICELVKISFFISCHPNYLIIISFNAIIAFFQLNPTWFIFWLSCYLLSLLDKLFYWHYMHIVFSFI